MPPEANSSSIERRAFVGASWLALFRFASQLFSWTATILVARVLEPSDYGLMEMAVIIPGYAMKLSELGLGPAIIQRPKTTQSELSSVFWFSAIIAMVLTGVCYAVAPFAAWLFTEPRLINLTQAVSVLFILQSLQVVPGNLLRKSLDFKRIGQIEILAVIVSSTTMLITAKVGGGVWTLILGFIALASAQLLLTFVSVKWMPSLHYRFSEVRGYLKFGLLISLQGTLFYIYDKSDKFFAGRAWQSGTLGQYTLALNLAQLPSEKITVLINHVAFPSFSLLASDAERFRRFYLKIINICATLVFPLFAGGYLVGAELIRLLLSEKWAPIGHIFEYLCLAQIIVSINAVNNFVHNSQGRAVWSAWNTVVCAVLVPLSFYLAVPYGLEAALVPWFSTYVLISVAWIAITIRTLGISRSAYLQVLWYPLAATLAMSAAIHVTNRLAGSWLMQQGLITSLAAKVLIGAAVYVCFLWIFDRRIFHELKTLRNK